MTLLPLACLMEQDAIENVWVPVVDSDRQICKVQPVKHGEIDKTSRMAQQQQKVPDLVHFNA